MRKILSSIFGVRSLESDVVIVGAGPIGSLAALHAAKKGIKVSILEQRKEIGIPDHCAVGRAGAMELPVGRL